MRTRKFDFKWYVMNYDINRSKLENYDIIPYFENTLKKLSKAKRPKTKEELDKFLDSEAMYQFWSRCEYELIVTDFPSPKTETKIDIYYQLKLNWNIFVDKFWEVYSKTMI